jgi:hypothetical protein
MRVPIPSVSPQVSPNGRYSATPVTPPQDATGGQLARFGEAVADAGAAVSRRADFEQDMLNDAMIGEADNLTADRFGAIQSEYLALTGRPATGDRRKQVEADMDAEVEKIGKTLTNKDQRDRWTAMMKDRRRRVTETTKAWETVQTRNFNVGVLEAGRDRARIDGRKDLMLQRVDDLAAVKGESDEERDLARLAATTQFHEEQIRLAADQEPARAQAMLDAATKAKEIAPAKLDELNALVRRSTVSADAAKLALQLMDPSRSPIRKPLSEQERPPSFQPDAEPQEPKRALTPGEAALQEEADYLRRYTDSRNQVNQWLLSGEIDADRGAATLANLDANHRAHLHIRAENANQVANRAEKWLSDNPLKGVSQMPSSMHTEVESNGLLGQMNDFADNKRYTTDPAVLEEAMALPDDVMRTMTPQMLRNRFRGKLDPRDWALVQSKHAKAFGTASQEDETALSQRERIDEAFHEATGISRTGGMTDADARRKYRFKEHAQSLINLEPKPKEVPTKRLKEILDTVVQDQVQVRSKTLGMDWLSGDVTKPRYELNPIYARTPEELAAMEAEEKIAYTQSGGDLIGIKAVPIGQRRAIIETMEQENAMRVSRGQSAIPITEKAIAASWVRAGRLQDPKK